MKENYDAPARLMMQMIVDVYSIRRWLSEFWES